MCYAVGISSRVFITACLCEVLESAAQLMELRQGLYSALIYPGMVEYNATLKDRLWSFQCPSKGFHIRGGLNSG